MLANAFHDALGSGVDIMVAQNRKNASLGAQPRQLRAPFFNILRIEVENISGDDDQIRLEPVDAIDVTSELRCPHHRPDMKIGNLGDPQPREGPLHSRHRQLDRSHRYPSLSDQVPPEDRPEAKGDRDATANTQQRRRRRAAHVDK